MRIRTMTRPNPSRWYYGTAKPTLLGFGTGLPADSSKVKFDYEWYSYIQDASPSNRSSYQAVYHEQHDAGLISGITSYVFPSGYPPLSVNPVIVYRYIPSNVTIAPDWGSMLDRLCATLYGRISKPSMLLLTLKELSKTVRMVKNPFNLLKRNFRKTVKQSTCHTLAKKGCDVWLEQLYGWQSMFNDIGAFSRASVNVIKEIQSSEIGEDEVSRFSSKEEGAGTQPTVFAGSIQSQSDWDNYIQNVPLNQTHFGPCIRVTPVYTWKAYVSCEASERAMRAGRITQSLLSNYDVSTWQSFRDLLWEVIPFSFVVDWFIDLRSIWAPLNRAMITSAGARKIGYSTKITHSADARAFLGRYYPTYQGGGGLWTNASPVSAENVVLSSVSPSKTTKYTRTPAWPPGTNPLNSFSVSGLTLTQMASGASLLGQKFL